MITGKIYKSDGTVEIVSYKNSDYFEMIGLTPENLMEQLRIKRNQLLTASDWRMTKDYPYADQLEWEDYRFELRELPQRIANGEVPAPTLDENGMLVFDEWPLKPGETA